LEYLQDRNIVSSEKIKGAMYATVKAIEYAVPTEVLTNSQLALDFPGWSVEKIEEKTGIVQRNIVDAKQCSSDLGVEAAENLFASGVCLPDDIDFLLFCTQSPDYFLPTTACIIQDRLGLPVSAGALDFNLGCSGFIYGLGLAKGLIETQQASSVLLLTAETYSKFIHRGDKSVRTLFGDAGAATLIQAQEGSGEAIGPFCYGTDGSGANNLIVPNGGARSPLKGEIAPVTEDSSGNQRSKDNLYMNGSEILTFTLRTVPKAVHKLLETTKQSIEDIDLFIFHQANKFMLEHLRKRCKIPESKFFLAYRKFGNTVSSTIPIALKEAQVHSKLEKGMKVMLVGFGVGYSWGATLIKWQG
jgi:3-oxoacyl-[acyl-carrier-protein] synthase-3